MLMKKWTSSENYIGEDYSDYYVFMSHTRDSGALEESNFFTALDMIGNVGGGVEVVTFNHWLCGWVEAIMIHENATEKIEKAEEILGMLEQYPVLDEDDYSKTQVEMGEYDPEEEF